MTNRYLEKVALKLHVLSDEKLSRSGLKTGLLGTPVKDGSIEWNHDDHTLEENISREMYHPAANALGVLGSAMAYRSSQELIDDAKLDPSPRYRKVGAIVGNIGRLFASIGGGLWAANLLDSKVSSEDGVEKKAENNKYLEKIAAKTLDEIDDDRSTSKRRANYIPGLTTVGAPAALIGYEAGKKTGGTITGVKKNKIVKVPERGYHVLKRDKVLRKGLLNKALVAAGIGGVVGNYAKEVFNNTQEEKYRAQREKRRKELREMRAKRKKNTDA